MSDENQDLAGTARDSAWAAVKQILTTSIVAALVSAAGWFGYASNQIDRERAVSAELRAEVSQLQMQVSFLQLQLAGEKIFTPTEAVAALLDSLRRPAWCKYWDVDDQHFRMLHITPQYEFEFDVSLARYKNQTDDDIYGPEKAAVYEQHDLEVFRERSSIAFTEPVRARDGRIEERRFWKFYHPIHQPQLHLVCGIQVTE